MGKKKNRIISVILGMFALLILGSTFAFFQKSESIDNRFQSAEAKIYLNEKFNPNDRWVPGEEKQKEVRLGNDGEIDAVLRVKFTPVLKLKDGTEDTAAVQDFKLNFADNFADNWVKQGDWYYYRKVLSLKEMTDVTLRSVTVSDSIGNDEHGIQTDYSEAVYSVKIEGELLQAFAASEAAKYMKWEMIPQVRDRQVIWNKD